MAKKMLIGLFETRDRARSAVDALKHQGFASGDIEMKDYNEVAKESHVERKPGESLLHMFLRDVGLIGGERPGAEYKGGETLVTVDADDEHIDKAADILNKNGAINTDERAARYKEAGGAKYTGAKAAEPHKIEEMEEKLKVGKREVSRGGVRIYTHPTERKVDETVSLREEKIDVERRPVDRPATEKEAGGFKDESFEVRARGEEPVVGKETRVKEEVEISKKPGERKETIHETLRGTKVDVERLSPEEQSAFENVESEFHKDYDRAYSATGKGYEDVLPAYRFGYHVGRDPYYGDGDWNKVEPKLKKDWEDHHYGGWDFYKGAIHKGWERAARHH